MFLEVLTFIAIVVYGINLYVDLKQEKKKCKHLVRYLREEKLIDMGRNKEFIYVCGECHEEIVERAW